MRPAKQDDQLPRLTDLDISATFDRRERDWHVIAKYRDVVVGTATCFDASIACMTSVWVHKQVRRRGVASAMFAYMEEKLGRQLEPSSKLTPDGQALWKARGLPSEEIEARMARSGYWPQDDHYGQIPVPLDEDIPAFAP